MIDIGYIVIILLLLFIAYKALSKKSTINFNKKEWDKTKDKKTKDRKSENIFKL